MKRMATQYVLAFDVGGTRIKGGVVTRSGKLLAQATMPTDTQRGPKRLVDQIARQARAWRRSLGGEPVGLGLGLTGPVDPEMGVVYLPGKMKDLEGFEIVPRLREALKLPVRADNDGRLAMVAERAYGQARDVDWAVTLTLGTGVGSGVLLEGRMLRDPHLQFGTQAGHLVMQNYGGRLCLTGARGTAETLCSATALVMSVRDGLQRGIASLLTEAYWKDAHAIDFAAVTEGARKKDRLCLEELDRWSINLGWLIVSVIHAYSPQRVILGGGATHAADLFLDRVKKHVHAHAFRYPPRRRIPIVVSKLGDHVGVLGAAALIWESAS